MGVSWVFETDKSVKAIERTLVAEGAKKIGVYSVDSTPYKPDEKVQGVINRIFVLHHSNYPQSTFVLAPSQSVECPRAVADRGFDLILAKLSAGLVQDTAGKFTVTGNEYQIVDFVCRFGPAAMGVASKGVVVEVEYTPSCIATQCSGMLTEFVEMFFPESVAEKPVVLRKGQPEAYNALDTLVQYLDVFNALRKKVAPVVPVDSAPEKTRHDSFGLAFD